MGTLNGWYGLAATFFFLFIILGCCGLSYPNAAAIALRPFTQNAGTASSLLGFLQIGLGGLISAGVGTLRIKGSISISLIMAVSATIAFLLVLAGGKKR